MRFLLYTHSLVSDWNHGNAHFLRGVVRDLVARGHEVLALEPENGWSRSNLEQDQGPGAIERFSSVLKNDPEFTNRDAVYFHLAESLVRIERPAAALPYYERILAEFEQSEYLEDAQKRVAELKANMAAQIKKN